MSYDGKEDLTRFNTRKETPELVCALCGMRVAMADHYTDAVMRHDSNGYHRVSFTAELEWKACGETYQ